MGNLSHEGAGFEVWHSQRTWFWMVVSRQGGVGAIGAAPSEAAAAREARSWIEEMFVWGHKSDTKEKSTDGSG